MKVKYIDIKKLKAFGNGSHIILPKPYKNQYAMVLVLESYNMELDTQGNEIRIKVDSDALKKIDKIRDALN